MVCVTYRRVLDWMIGFIDTLYNPLGTKGNYSAIEDLYTLQFIDANASNLGPDYSHPGNGFITATLSLQITSEVYFVQPTFFPTFLRNYSANCQLQNSTQF
jgi:hypothetical protein